MLRITGDIVAEIQQIGGEMVTAGKAFAPVPDAQDMGLRVGVFLLRKLLVGLLGADAKEFAQGDLAPAHTRPVQRPGTLGTFVEFTAKRDNLRNGIAIGTQKADKGRMLAVF